MKPMKQESYFYRILQIKMPVPCSKEQLKAEVAKRFHLRESQFEMKIARQSLDARKKESLRYLFAVDITIGKPLAIPAREKANVKLLTGKEHYRFEPSGTTLLSERPVIVGTGPCGLFCGYQLAKWGYRPILIERGEPVEERDMTVKRFWEDGVLDTESNVQFGEGGAGTFSDGKLNTLVKDPSYRIQYVLETFVRYGAPQEVTYEQKPHIGTDCLRTIIRNMREDMIRMGGEFRFNTKLTDILVEDSALHAITVSHKDNKIAKKDTLQTETIDCSVLVLALGHSARDTFSMLYDKRVMMTPKPFAVGVRIEHPQTMISEQQYGKEGARLLPAASYKLTAKAADGRGVYTFCMCPGGYVVNASSEPGRLAVNGMSYSGRDGVNANSAVIVTVKPEDFLSEDVPSEEVPTEHLRIHPLAGVAYQRRLEELAYRAADGKIPVQTYADFKEKTISASFGRVIPQTKGAYGFADLNQVLPKNLSQAIKDGIARFGQMLPGFDRDDAVLSGVESRTSSPVRIERDDTYQSNIRGIYPSGEGAGYAGGITSAAVDGIRTAEKIAEKYRNLLQ